MLSSLPSSPTPTSESDHNSDNRSSSPDQLSPSALSSAIATENNNSVPRGIASSVHAPELPTPSDEIAHAPPPPTISNQPASSRLPTPTPSKSTSSTPIPDSTSNSNISTLKTPNVYINGLPPHFPEDELFALTSPFGGVKSVRSFTRHVGERSSGYGFVLFDTVESAERCIEGLRKYRNLHPSFSKQIHKIPGTAYASIHTNRSSSATLSVQESDSSEKGNPSDGHVWMGESEGSSGGDSFKARMEKLRDDNSTNLYIEGLPLSIDDATLSALVSPFAIRSSRFFQTKLSHPPRIIAFVRLETRAAAEEIIERLHGRMVRGWNDPGSRISVRFADTNEQRELRRAERSAKEGDRSPARLTIAQAALLNLRGQEIQPHAVVPSPTRHLPHLPSVRTVGFHSEPGSDRSLDYNTINRQDTTEYPRQILANPLTGVDYGRLPTTGSDYLNYNGSNQGARMSAYQHLPFSQQTQQDVTPEMAILLDSLRQTGAPFVGSSHAAGGLVEYDGGSLRPRGQSLGISPGPGMDLSPSYAGLQLPVHVPMPMSGPVQVLGQAQAHNGFTPAEEMILHAHASARSNSGLGVRGHVQQHATMGHAPRHISGALGSTNVGTGSIGVGMRGRRSVASALSLLPPHGDSMLQVPTTEDDFQTNAALYHRPSMFADEERMRWMDGGRDRNARVGHAPPLVKTLRSSSDFDTISTQQHQQRQRQRQELHRQQENEHQLTAASSYPNVQPHTQSSSQNTITTSANANAKQGMARTNIHRSQPQQTHAPHIRSTTLPAHHSSSSHNSNHQRHFQHSSLSMTIPNSSSTQSTINSNSHRTNQNQNQYSTNDTTSLKSPNNVFDRDHDSNSNVNFSITNSSNIQTRDQYETAQHFSHQPAFKFRNHNSNSHNDNGNGFNNSQASNNVGGLDNITAATASPPLESPALTYSSSTRTPATLSPSTPFFGSFGNSTVDPAFEGGEHIEGGKKALATLGET